MSKDTTLEQYNWPSTLNPDFDTVKEWELTRQYGGRESPGYIHRVLGQHDAPEYGVFDLGADQSYVDETLDDTTVSIGEGDDFEVAVGIEKGEYYLGCDLGYARGPSEFVVYRVEGPVFVHVMRVHLEGVNYARQMEILVELHNAYDFSEIGIDCGNSCRAVAHNLIELGTNWDEKVRAYEFGSAIELAPLPDGKIVGRRIKEFMTELIVDRLNDGTVVLPPCPDQGESICVPHLLYRRFRANSVYKGKRPHYRCRLLCSFALVRKYTI